MGILQRLYDKLHPIQPEDVPEVKAPDLSTAELAIQSALEDLRTAESNAPKVAALVSRADYHVSRNHFSELARASMGNPL